MLLIWAVLASGCAWGAEPMTAELPPGVSPITVPGLHNVFTLRTNLLSGSAPESEEAFQSLERLGVKTIITVDGARADLESAHRHGIRYIHLPHGYDGIRPETQAELVKAFRGANGPVFIHCHHGKHRGPVAAAVICQTDGGWSSLQAEAWLLAAGTGTNYVGLYETVRRFKPPTAAELGAARSEFPEAARVSGVVDAMVAIDVQWDRLNGIRKAGFRAPAEHPDLLPANEALILAEHFRELRRTPDAEGHGGDFLVRLQSAEAKIRSAEDLLRRFTTHPTDPARVELGAAFDAVGRTCVECHQKHRDPSK